MAPTHETYVYYEKHKEGTHIEGFTDQTFDIDSEVTRYVKAESKRLTRVQSYALQGKLLSDSKGDTQGTPEATVTLAHEMDISVVPLIKHFYETKTLNIAILLTMTGQKLRSLGQAPRESGKHHFFTYLMAQARIVDLDVSRQNSSEASDLVTITYKYGALFWQDHDKSGLLGETTWQDPQCRETNFDKVWNMRAAG